MNAHRSLILITSLLLVSNLTGCANFDLFGKRTKPVEVKTVAVEKTPLNLPDPDPLQLKPFQWVVVTPDNAEAVLKKLEEDGQNPALFALTDDGYQKLAITIAELRNLINTQRAIIIKYKEYYESPNSAEKK